MSPAPGRRPPSILESFNVAFEGIIHVLRTQRNMRIHFLIAVAVLIAALAVDVSKIVVTGDVTQVDLPREQASGLIHVREILGAIDGIEFVEFGNQDVVRHVLVQRIVEAYKRHADETGTQRRK